MKRFYLLHLLFLLACLLAAVPLRGEDLSLDQHLRLNRRFASQLLAEQDYQRASDEYQKLAFHYASVDSTLARADTLRYLAGLCQRRLGDYSRSNEFLSTVSSITSGLRTEADLLQAANYYNLRAHEQSLAIMTGLDSCRYPISSRQNKRQDHLRIANFLATQQLDMAQDTVTQLSGVDSLKFAELINQTKSAPMKRPVLAAVMSTVVPGSGKIYTGNTWDGITSLIVCLFSGWRAWEGFCESGIKSFDGWLFGAVTAYFYLGNIYGSAVSAKLTNERTQNDLRKELERIINAEN